MRGRPLLGLGFVVSVAVLVAVLLADVPGARTLLVRLRDHATGRSDVLTITFDQRPDLARGDPVYSIEGEAFALQGKVMHVGEGVPCEVVVKVDPTVVRRFHDHASMVAMHPEADLAWVLRTLIPPDLRSQTVEQLGRVWESQKDVTLESLREPVITLLADLVTVLADSLPEALARHEAERQTFFDAFAGEIFPTHMKPHLEAAFIHRLEERIQPLAGRMGVEIWEAVTFGDLMSLSWVGMKDIVGAAKEEEMARQLGLILEVRALPVLRRHAPIAFKEALAAAAEGVADPRIREAVDQTVTHTMAHPAFQTFMGLVVKSWILDNQRLRQRCEEALASPAFRKPFEDLYKAAEPTLEEALEEILTRPDREGMDHQLVRVLRRVVLKKDEHYLLLMDQGDRPLDPGRAIMTGTIGRDP